MVKLFKSPKIVLHKQKYLLINNLLKNCFNVFFSATSVYFSFCMYLYVFWSLEKKCKGRHGFSMSLAAYGAEWLFSATLA